MSGRGWLLFAAMGVIWGIPYLLIKVAVDGVSVPVLVFARTAVGAVVLLPLALRARNGVRLRRYWLPIVTFAALEIMVPWYLISDAERSLTSSMTGLLIAASPAIAVVVGRLTGSGEHIGPLRWVGLAIGLVGVGVLAGPELGDGRPWPVIEVLLVAVCYASAPQIADRTLGEVPTQTLTAICLTGAAVVYAPAAIATWPSALPATDVLIAIAGLALICTALAFLVFFALIREVGTSRALVFTYLNPAVAVTAGVLLLGEPLTPSILGSFALILAGSVLATWSRTAAPGTTEATPAPVTRSPST